MRIMSKPSPEFLDRFLVHLALQLLTNVQWIEEWLSGQRRYLYWRSPIVKRNGLGFIDWTLELNPTPMLRLGFFFHSSSSSTTATTASTTTTTASQYVQCYPLTRDQLDQHVHTIGLDIDSGPPEALAKMMASALASDTIQATIHDNTITCSWFHPEIQDRGECVNWPIQYQSNFDAVATNLLYNNLDLSAAVKEKQGPISASEEILVERYLQEWFDRQQQQHSAIKDSLVGIEPVASSTNTSSDNSRQKTVVTRRGPNVVAVATKSRKKKSKIMYYDPSSHEGNDSTQG